MNEFKFPTIEDYIKNRKPYKRQRRNPVFLHRKKVTYLRWSDLSSKTIEELITFDIRPLYKKDFVFLISFFAIACPRKLPAFLRQVMKIHIADLERRSLRKYFKLFKQKVRHTKQTLRALRNGGSCDRKCKWCPLDSCSGIGRGKNKIQKLSSWLKNPRLK